MVEMVLYQTLISESPLSRRVIPFISKPYSLISCANKVIRRNTGCVRFLLRLLPENKGYIENIDKLFISYPKVTESLNF